MLCGTFAERTLIMIIRRRLKEKSCRRKGTEETQVCTLQVEELGSGGDLQWTRGPTIIPRMNVFGTKRPITSRVHRQSSESRGKWVAINRM